MKTNLRCSALLGTVAVIITLPSATSFGLGSDYPKDQPISVAPSSAWPKGLTDLVNTTNRVHGFFVNAADVFFFAGPAARLNAFLQDYSQIQDIEKHLLVLNDGVAEAKSPWEKTGRPCDWKLYGIPKAWLNAAVLSGSETNQETSAKVAPAAVRDTNYVLEVHFWTDGRIAWDQLVIPRNVELAGSSVEDFAAITNGMTRAEVRKQLPMDGGLQGASPVRFAHPRFPYLKINVEFDFNRNAADKKRAMINENDKVIRVSKPYLERPFAD